MAMFLQIIVLNIHQIFSNTQNLSRASSGPAFQPVNFDQNSVIALSTDRHQHDTHHKVTFDGTLFPQAEAPVRQSSRLSPDAWNRINPC